MIMSPPFVYPLTPMKPEASVDLSRKAASGFSLPEVTMAVGIAAMAIVLLLGLLPSGMSSIRGASNTLAETRIYQQIIAEIQTANWGATTGGALPPGLTPYAGARRFFDDQGSPLDLGGADSIRLTYVSEILLEGPGGPLAVPGGAPSPDMLTVRINIAAVPDARFSFNGEVPFSSRAFTVARQF